MSSLTTSCYHVSANMILQSFIFNYNSFDDNLFLTDKSILISY